MLTLQSRFEKFENAFINKRCFILGNGPSIKHQDLTWLRREHVFVVNLFTIHPEFFHFRHCWYCLGDPRFYQRQQLLPEIALKLACHPTVNCFFERQSLAAVIQEKDLDPKRIYFMEIDSGKTCWEGHFHANPSRKLCWGYSVIIDQCLPLAIYMGFSPIYLLGCDCNYNIDPEKPDFTSAYFYNPKTVSEKYLESLFHSSRLPDQFNLSGKIIASYRTVKDYCDTHQIGVYNAGIGGDLKVFERVDFSSLFGQ